MIKAVKAQFPDSRIDFKQALRRKMLKLKITEEEVALAMCERCIDGLTLIRRCDIVFRGIPDVRRMIKRDCRDQGILYSRESWKTFWKYFMNTWITQFVPEWWNVNGLNEAIVNRTNSPFAKYNRTLNDAFSVPHRDVSRDNVRLINDISNRRARAPSRASPQQFDPKRDIINRVREGTLRSICAEAPRSWSDQLPMVEFALNNAVTTPYVPLTLRGGTVASTVSGGEARKAFSSQVSEIEPESLKRQLSSFIDDRLMLISRVRDAMASDQEKQMEYSDRKGRGNFNVFKVGELVLLDTKNLPLKVASSIESNKLKHRFIGPFAVLTRHGAAYTIDLPKSIATHPTFYVGRLKRNHDPLGPPSRTEEDQGENTPPRNEAESAGQPELPVSKPVTDTQAGTHASHTNGMTVPSGKNSGKNYTRKPSGTNTPAAHKRASDHAPHGLERLSLDGVPSGRKPELGGQHAHGAHESHDQERPSLGEGPQGSPACQPERQPDHQVQAQGLSRSHRRDLEADGPRRLTGTPQSPDPKLRVQKDKVEKEPRTQTRARAPPALLDRNGELHYHVERVVQERRRSGKRQLLVKWRGYPSSQNSWEPEDRLQVDCPKAVEIWDLQQPGRK
ncbi:Pol protein [Phytophthora palmivora]|uniref:Pol protein n=1 Tax=Phytophthora palmivora TaxID=4796 RepID=A0A2P4WXC1_9STRA|nr:Pol protein [Phytophthora palmivora]